MSRVLADKRKPDCRHYDRCLDVAAKANEVFTCEGCTRYEPEPCRNDEYDAACCKALVATITYPEEYSEQQPQKLVRHFLDAHSNFEEPDHTGTRTARA
ncbi:hypothetical protein HNR65_003426 [Desulfosalsimonas propionicica]|uniref:Uncharacterized protein n=1 Tax=Desulfosalsimonas propionicica TaxID=332175 RepID=A0A7W0HM60_9BACT|nr:hypothetical protein [Desulfosalsimonas propionicica]MBA2883069.1 hypothetical protein [Desulfosalsimonas propionicica]